jgi:hypothetical protein
VWFKLPIPPTSLEGTSLIYSNTIFIPFIITPLLWNMENVYGTMKGTYKYLGMVGIIELIDFIQELDNWCDM